ncbi:MAG: fibronectin type III domain-containing protein [Bacteroidales bacterium]|jgi:hypothetical protein|nr:fibronectin type III domain-containing protein [Bacteroidales bacterium]
MRKLFFLFATACFAISNCFVQLTFAQDSSCNITNFPFEESFDASSSLPLCWTLFSGTAGYPIITTTNHSSPNSLLLSNRSWAISPQINENISLLKIQFYARAESASLSGTLQVGVMSSLQDTTTFELIEEISPTPASTWIEHEVFLSSAQLNGVGNYIVIRQNNSPTTNYWWWIDDINIDYIPSCIKPNNIILTNYTTNSLDIQWENTNADYSLWNIEYMTANNTTWDSAIMVSVGQNQYSLTSLNANTAYKIRIKSLCGEENSLWSNEYVFRTACLGVEIPYYMNFDSIDVVDNMPLCWSRPFTATYPNIYTTSSSAHSGNKVMYFSSSSGYSYAVTPQIGEDINLLRMRFYSRLSSNGNGSLLIGVTSTPLDTTSIEVVDTIRMTTNKYNEYEVLFNQVALSGTGNYIVIKHIGGNIVYLDDIIIDSIPFCTRPNRLEVQNITTTSCNLSWNDPNGNASLWSIAYMPSYQTSWDSAVVDLSSVTNFNILDLLSATTYKVRVQSLCGDDESLWSYEITFDTECEIVSTIPWSENFDNLTASSSSFPICWKKHSTYTTHPYIVSGTSASHTNPNSLRFASAQNGTSWAILPQISENINLLKINFWAKAESANSGSLTIGVMSDNLDTTTFESVQTFEPSSASTWGEYEVLFNSTQLSGGNKSIAFRQNSISANYFWWIDDIVVDYLSLCDRPSDITFSNLQETSLDVSWSENNSSSWIIQYTLESNASWEGAMEEITILPTISLNSLTANTQYKIRIKASCGEDTSSWSSSISFTTPCIALSIPIEVEPFNLLLPSTCWTKASGQMPLEGEISLTMGGGSWSLSTDTEIFLGEASCVKLNLYNTTHGWLISPSIDLGDSLSLSQVELDVVLKGYDSGNIPQTNGVDDIFGIVISTDNGLSWNRDNAILWTNEANTLRELNSLYPEQHLIIPLINPQTNEPYQGKVKIGIYAGSSQNNADNFIYVDNFVVNPFVPCPEVLFLTISPNTTQAEISFTENGSASLWEYVITTDTSIIEPISLEPISFSTNPYIINGLTANTNYRIWVRSVCDNSSYSSFQESEFKTLALPATIPFICDFENEEENLLWSNIGNKNTLWAFGKAATNGPNTINIYDSNAAYISKDGGLTYGSDENYTYSYLYREINFGENMASFILSYDWKCQGSTTNNGNISDALAVYLLDEDETISPIYPNYFNDALVFNYNQTSWQRQMFSLENVSGIKRLVFLHVSSNNLVYPQPAIDNISIKEIACNAPSNILISNITTSSAQISWDDSEEEDFIITYSSENNQPIIENVQSSPYIISGLIPATTYQISISAICQGDTTLPSNSISFSTPCFDEAITEFPWIEGFENGDNCWGKENVLANVAWTNGEDNTYYTAHSGSRFANLYCESYSGAKTMLISPLLDLTMMNQPAIEFFHIQNAYINDQDELKVYYRTSQTDSWIEIMNFTNNIASWQKDSAFLPNPSSTYQVAFEGYAKFGRGIAIDDIKIYDSYILNCPPPSAISAIAYNNSATLSWQVVDEGLLYEVKIGEDGQIDSVNTAFYQINNLNTNTNYIAYIRTKCEAGYSLWQSVEFTTQNIPSSATSLAPTLISQFSARMNGEYVCFENEMLYKGFYYKDSISNSWNEVLVNENINPYYYDINNLKANTKYTYKAFIITYSNDTIFGEDVCFTTLEIISPVVEMLQVSEITSSSATFSAIVENGTLDITSRSFELIKQGDNWEDAILISGQGISPFSATYNGLDANTQYLVRAMVTSFYDQEIKTYGNEVDFSTPLSIIDAENKDEYVQISLYPNPAKDNTTLKVSNLSGIVEISIVDIKARKVYSKNINIENELLEKIDVSFLAKGVYFVQIKGKNINTIRKLIIK